MGWQGQGTWGGLLLAGGHGWGRGAHTPSPHVQTQAGPCEKPTRLSKLHPGWPPATTETDWHNKEEGPSLHCCGARQLRFKALDPWVPRITSRLCKKALGTVQKQETASQSKPNTVLLSTHTRLHYQGNLMFRGGGGGGLKYRTLSPWVAGHMSQGAQRVSTSERHSKFTKNQKKKRKKFLYVLYKVEWYLRYTEAGTSLVGQWLRIRLAMQGMRVQSLVRGLRSHVLQSNYWACMLWYATARECVHHS